MALDAVVLDTILLDAKGGFQVGIPGREVSESFRFRPGVCGGFPIPAGAAITEGLVLAGGIFDCATFGGSVGALLLSDEAACPEDSVPLALQTTDAYTDFPSLAEETSGQALPSRFRILKSLVSTESAYRDSRLADALLAETAP
jgi:hypothetical protein